MFDHATRNANSPIGYNLAFIRNTYEFIIIEHTLVDCLNLPRPKRHTSSLQLHPHTHHTVAPGFVDRPRRSDCTAGQMDGEAGWCTTSGNIGLPPWEWVDNNKTHVKLTKSYSYMDVGSPIGKV